MFRRKRKLGSHTGFWKRPQAVAVQGIDIQVDSPEDGRIQLTSRYLFHDLSSALCREFLERVLHTQEIETLTITSKGTQAEIRYCPETYSRRETMQSIAASMRRKPSLNGHTTNGFQGRYVDQATDSHNFCPDSNGVISLYRYGATFTAWQIKHELPGRLRLKHPVLHRKRAACHVIEQELINSLGIDSYKVNALTSSVLIVYDTRIVQKRQIIEIFENALAQAEIPADKDLPDLTFLLCTVNLPLAAAAQFFAPSLFSAAAIIFLITSIPSIKGAYEVIRKERRLGVDVLDTLIVMGCLFMGAIFAGAVVNWCLSLSRMIVQKTRDDSTKMLLNIFGKQPRHVWLYRDGAEVEILLDNLQPHDIIVVHTGEVVPVDGIVTEGLATIDQHVLTGEATPAEKTVGDTVFASTVMLSGKLYVRVEKAGSQTTSAQVSQLLNDAAGYTLFSQSRGEVLADRAVIPTMAMGLLAYTTRGTTGAMAVINSDLGTGIRMAAPLAMLTSLTLCAKNSILVKDGRALELVNRIDTVLFDKTGTLTRERPEVGAVIVCSDHYHEDDILGYAAAAEYKFSHPIAKAIQSKAEERNLMVMHPEDSEYHVGYGITVGLNENIIRVGSARFMEMEGIPLPAVIQQAMETAHEEGHSLVMVAVDDELGGAVELRPSYRPEVRHVIAELRQRGIKNLAVISGDHEGPTRKLAEELGIDQYFANVLPQDKAQYVEALQNEGKRVCFVGDGINDSIALKKADVSVSLRGASSIATDTAQVVFMEESLGKLCTLIDISRDLDRNVRRSWHLILLPNIVCIGGAFLFGFGFIASVWTNNMVNMAALANGLLPLRKAAKLKRQHD